MGAQQYHLRARLAGGQVGSSVKVYLKPDAVAERLARMNLSQNWVALRLGISTGYMSQLMKQTRQPSPRIRKRLLGVLKGATFDDLFEIRKAPPGGSG